MNTFVKISTFALALGFVTIDSCAVTAAEITEAEIAAQIREFEKGAAESAIKYKHERLRPPPPQMMFDGDGVYPTCGVTLRQFIGLQPRMTYGQVASALGCDGIQTSESNSSGYSGAIYGWQGAASKGANMSAQFQNDIMVNKSQSGLR